jgi:hypothetical protein
MEPTGVGGIGGSVDGCVVSGNGEVGSRLQGDQRVDSVGGFGWTKGRFL